MCGYFGSVRDSPLTEKLMNTIGMENQTYLLRTNPGGGPASSVDIILSGSSGLTVAPAIWWLLLDRSDTGQFKPSRYTSFNTRYDRLNVKGSAGYHPFRHSRCIIPATYIIEGDGPKGARQYHKIEPSNCSFALGGLYRQWTNHETGETLNSCSIITLPPHQQWKTIHSKSTPMFLPIDDKGLIDRWLDPNYNDTSEFDKLLAPAFHDQLTCTPIERPGNQVVIGDPIYIG